MQKQFEISREFVLNIQELIVNKDEKQTHALLSNLHPADIAEVLELISLEEAIFVFLLLNSELGADVMAELEEDDREKLLKALPSEVIAKQILDNMESDDAADLLGDMDEQRQEEVLSHMEDVDQAGDIVDLLNYEERTAGGLMAKEYIKVMEGWTVDRFTYPGCERYLQRVKRRA